MSVKIASLVWGLKCESHTTKMVLLKLADHAKDDGSDVYPAMRSVMEDCEVSESTVQRAIKWAKAQGILVEVASPGNRPNRYRFVVEKSVEGYLRWSHRPGSHTDQVVTQTPSGSHTDHLGSHSDYPLERTVNEPSTNRQSAGARKLKEIMDEVPGFKRSTVREERWQETFDQWRDHFSESDLFIHAQNCAAHFAEKPHLMANGTGTASPISALGDWLVRRKQEIDRRKPAVEAQSQRRRTWQEIKAERDREDAA